MSEPEARGPKEKAARCRAAYLVDVQETYCGWMPAALMVGTHLSIDALSWARIASGVASLAAGRSTASSVSRVRIFSSERAATSAPLSLVMMSFGVPLG